MNNYNIQIFWYVLVCLYWMSQWSVEQMSKSLPQNYKCQRCGEDRGELRWWSKSNILRCTVIAEHFICEMLLVWVIQPVFHYRFEFFISVWFHKLSWGAEQISWQTWLQSWHHTRPLYDPRQRAECQIIWCGLILTAIILLISLQGIKL